MRSSTIVGPFPHGGIGPARSKVPYHNNLPKQYAAASAESTKDAAPPHAPHLSSISTLTATAPALIRAQTTATTSALKYSSSRVLTPLSRPRRR